MSFWTGWRSGGCWSCVRRGVCGILRVSVIIVVFFIVSFLGFIATGFISISCSSSKSH